jgi:hypothetical protein
MGGSCDTSKGEFKLWLGGGPTGERPFEMLKSDEWAILKLLLTKCIDRASNGVFRLRIREHRKTPSGCLKYKKFVD